MKENLLHFVWKYKLFSSNNLISTTGETIDILSVGSPNLNAGPDFLNAKIRIGDQLWAGNIEIHIHSSDWYAHGHEIDEGYNSVILHVVWDHNVEVFNISSQKITTLEIKDLIAPEILSSYEYLFKKDKKWINCEKDIAGIDSSILANWLERLYVERLEQKSIQIQQILAKNCNNWEATLFILLAKNFGLKVNGEAFLNLANSIDFSIVRKVSRNRNHLEALFFGQAGLLSDAVESMYHQELKTAYRYLKRKYKLQSISRNQVLFYRLRPNNFPTIRLSQLAGLYHKNQGLFSKVMAIQEINDCYALFDIATSPFWDSHYTFEKESKRSLKKLTDSFVDLLLINTVIPLKFMYLKSLGKSEFTSLQALIQQIKPEKNTIISKFNALGIESEDSFKTQALLQLKKEYCDIQLCLNCAVGRELLKP